MQGSLSYCHLDCNLGRLSGAHDGMTNFEWKLCLMQVNEVDRLMEIIRNAAQEGSIVFYTLADPIMAEAAQEACEVRLSSHCSLNSVELYSVILMGRFKQSQIRYSYSMTITKSGLRQRMEIQDISGRVPWQSSRMSHYTFMNFCFNNCASFSCERSRLHVTVKSIVTSIWVFHGKLFSTQVSSCITGNLAHLLYNYSVSKCTTVRQGVE